MTNKLPPLPSTLAAREGDHWYALNKTHGCGDYIAAAIRNLK
jgi:hypothetical protein